MGEFKDDNIPKRRKKKQIDSEVTKNSKIKRFILPFVLILIGFPLMFSNQISAFMYENWLDKNQSAIINDLSSETIEDNLSSLGNEEELFDYESIQNIDGFNIPKVDMNNFKNAIGIITIPSVNLEQPILYGTTNANLMLGATTMKPEQKMGEGNYALAGHNHHSRPVLFQPIRNVEEGASIFITDKKKVYAYKVISKEVVEPHRVDVIEDVPDKKLITLVSCYAADGSNRIIVTGELYEVKDYVE